MFRTKAEVDLHAKDLMSKLHTEHERVNKCFVIGKQYAAIREFGEAVSYLEKYLRSEPSNKAETLKILGDILLEQKRFEDAFVKYRTAVEVSSNPVNKEALNRLVDLLSQGFGPDEPSIRQKYFDLQANLPRSPFVPGVRPPAQSNNIKSLLTLRGSPISNSSQQFARISASATNGKGIRATSTPKKLMNTSISSEQVMRVGPSPERIHANVLALERRVDSLFDKFDETADSLSISMANLSDKMTSLDINVEDVKETVRIIKDTPVIQQLPLQQMLPPPMPILPPPPAPQPIVIQTPQCSSNNIDRELQRLERKLDDVRDEVKATRAKIDSLPNELIVALSDVLTKIKITQEKEMRRPPPSQETPAILNSSTSVLIKQETALSSSPSTPSSSVIKQATILTSSPSTPSLVTKPATTLSSSPSTPSLVTKPATTLSSSPSLATSTAAENPAATGGLFSGFSFGLSPGSLGFADLAKGGTFFGENKTNENDTKGFGVVPTPVFGAAAAPRQRSSSQGSEGGDEFEPTQEFVPVIPLPPLVEVKTGDEDEDLLMEVRAKVYRFDRDAKEWKERGVGNLKLLQHKEDRGCVRVLMWREKVLKLAINHRLTSDIKPVLYQNNPKVLSWSAVDHSDEEPKPELFTIRFGTEDKAAEFKTKMEEMIRLVGSSNSSTPQKSESARVTLADSSSAHSEAAPQPSLSELFKKAEGSWDCGACYTNNKSDSLKCVACATPKPGQEGQENKLEVKQIAPLEPAAPKFTFGFGMTTPTTLSSSPSLVTKPTPSAAAENPAATGGLFSGFSFGLSSGSLGFADLAKGGTFFGENKTNENDTKGFGVVPTPVFGAAAAPRHRSSSQGSEGGDEFEPTQEFVPVIPLPPLVEVKTGDEDEDLLMEVRAKVYRFDRDAKEWKERGVGNLKLLQHKEDRGCVRVLMWREKVLKLAINHRLTSDIKPVLYQNNPKVLSWSAVDHSDEEPKPELFTIRFGSEDKAAEFKAKMEEMIDVVGSSNTSTPKKSEIARVTVADSSSAHSEAAPQPSLSELFKKAEGSWDCGTCYINNKSDSLKCVACATPKPGQEGQENKSEVNQDAPVEPVAPKFSFGFGQTTPTTLSSSPSLLTKPTPSAAAENPAATGGLFSGFSFGLSSGSLGFADLAKGGTFFGENKTKENDTKGFGGVPTPVFGAAAAPRQRSASQGSEGGDEFEPTQEFVPVIPLPPLVEVKTGDEDEDLLMEVRAKVYRFDRDAKEWKERGVGNLKLLQHKEDRGCVRVLMWREKVLKLAINHRLTSDIKPVFYQNNPKVLSWSAVDHSDEEPKPELFTIRFGSEDKAAEFKTKMEELIRLVDSSSSSTPQKSENARVTLADSSSAHSEAAPQPSLSELFKKAEGSWDCGTCYINNKSDSLKCVACATPKPGHENKLEVKQIAPLEPAAPFTFGFGMTTPVQKTGSEPRTTTAGETIPEPWVDFDASGSEYAELAALFE